MRRAAIRTFWAMTVLLLARAATANGAVVGLDLADWSARTSHNFVANPPKKDEIEAFRLKLFPGNQDRLASYRFADLRDSGQLSLLMSTGRFGNFTSVIDKTPAGFEVTEFPSGFGGADVEDIGGNGKSVVMVNTDFTDYEGAMHCVATWPVIYAWTGSSYANVSRNYLPYYRRKLESLKKQIAGDPSNRQGKVDCLEAQAAKIERFLGDKTAGLNDAIRWSQSKDRYQREFAAPILADIGTLDAMHHLRRLTRDGDKTNEVATEAALALATKLNEVHTPEAKKELKAFPGDIAKSYLQNWENWPQAPDVPEMHLIPFSELAASSAKPTPAK